MGSMPRLKKKIDLNYRKGTTSKSCNYCDHFLSKFKLTGIQGGLADTVKPRCKIMGMGEGRRYDINPDHICDAHDQSEYLSRLKGEGFK